MTNIAVLITSYNRKEKTISCLRSLKIQVLPAETFLTFFITDDNSKDGTCEAIRNEFPDVSLFHGDGSLFWAGGMRNSWNEALKIDPDYYLLVNDDVLFKEKAVNSLLECSHINKSNSAISVGSTMDIDKKIISYGGRRLGSSTTWNSGYLVYSETEYLDCDVANANILLIPKEIVKKIGILSNKFTHGLADYDYTLKAKKAGYNLIVAPGFLGTCTDDHGNNWKSSSNTKLKDRLAYLKSPKGLAYKEYLGFIKEHFPKSYYPAFLKLWIKTLFPIFWDILKK